MVEAVEQPSAPRKEHPQKNGIDKINSDNDKANAVIDKVIEKIVRVSVSDNRVYLGKLMAVD